MIFVHHEFLHATSDLSQHLDWALKVRPNTIQWADAPFYVDYNCLGVRKDKRNNTTLWSTTFGIMLKQANMRKVEGWLITIRQCLQVGLAAYTFDMTAWICKAHHCSDMEQGVY